MARDGEIIWEEAFGFADKEKGIPATKETMYYVASVTKTLTATALKVLEEGKQILTAHSTITLDRWQFGSALESERSHCRTSGQTHGWL